jgi:hypothetical protein
MKKFVTVLLILVALLVVTATSAFADDPTDAQLYCAWKTNAGLPNGLQLLQQFTTQEGFDRQLTTTQAWQNAYPFITNEFCSVWGEKAPIINPGEKTEMVSPDVRWYAPYLRWLYNQLVAVGALKK